MPIKCAVTKALSNFLASPCRVADGRSAYDALCLQAVTRHRTDVMWERNAQNQALHCRPKGVFYFSCLCIIIECPEKKQTELFEDIVPAFCHTTGADVLSLRTWRSVRKKINPSFNTVHFQSRFFLHLVYKLFFTLKIVKSGFCFTFYLLLTVTYQQGEKKRDGMNRQHKDFKSVTYNYISVVRWCIP